jgi:hypothetical protein
MRSLAEGVPRQSPPANLRVTIGQQRAEPDAPTSSMWAFYQRTGNHDIGRVPSVRPRGGDCREGFRHKDRPHDNIDDPPKALKTPRQSWVGEVDRIGRKYTQSLGLISTTWRSRCAPPWPPRTRPAHRSRTMIAGVQPRKGGIVFFNMLNMRCSFSWVGPDHE